MIEHRKQTLVILSPGFAADATDSVCLPFLQQLVNTCSESFPQLKVVVLAFQYPFSELPYQWNGATIIPFNGRNKGKLHRLWLWIKVRKKLNGLKKQHHITGLLSLWYGECALMGKWFGKKNSIPHFTWLLGQDARKGNAYTVFSRPKAEELIALSDFLVKEFENNYHVKPAHVIPVGIDTKLYGAMPLKKNIDVLGVGSLIPLKRYDLFIDVIKALKNQRPDVRAVLCGVGPENKKLAAMIAGAGLENSLTLFEDKTHAEVLQLMQRSKLFLHPSSYEGFGIVCLEALYAGAQVISFCKPMNTQIQNWHVVNDVAAMTALSEKLLNDSLTNHDAVLPYTIKDTARAIMQLFDYNETATS